MPNCPQCSTLMVLVKEQVFKDFPNVAESPRIKLYKCTSGITEFCQNNII